MRLLAPAALLLSLALCTGPAAALVSFVASTDADAGAPYRPMNGRIAWIDADLNGQPGHTMPAEPIYLDADGSASVSYGDLRLTSYGSLPPGTGVGVSDSDLGLPLLGTKAWFAATDAGIWYIDMDQNVRVSVGDLRLQGEDAGTRVAAGAPDAGQTLNRQQIQMVESVRLGWSDPNGNNVVDPGESLYLDLANDAVSRTRVDVGDLRLATRPHQPAVAPAADPLPAAPNDPDGPSRAEGDGTGAEAQTSPSGDGFTRVLSIVNLVGLVAVAAWLATTRRH